MSALKVECQQRESERNELQKSVDSVKGTVWEDGRSEFDGLNNEIEALQKEMESMETKKGRIRKEIVDRDGQIAAAQKRKIGLKEYILRVRQKISDNKVEHQRKLRKLDQFEAEVMRKIENLRREHEEKKDQQHKKRDESRISRRTVLRRRPIISD